MRCLLPCLLAAAATTAEVARRDLQIAVEVGDPAFDYTLGTSIGDLHGSDAFDAMATLRLGGRWAWTSAGAGLAPLVGVDLEVCDAPMRQGGMRGYGLSLAGGGTWAVAERLSLDGEGFIGVQRVDIEVDDQAGTQVLAADGDIVRHGLRARLSWNPWPHWSLGAEAGWSAYAGDLAADGGRDLALSGGGLFAGVALAWRPSARPGGVE